MPISRDEIIRAIKPWVLSMVVQGGVATYAPIGASFLTVAANASLTAERVITAGDIITLTDGGANSTLTVAVDSAKLAWTSGKLTIAVTATKTLTLAAANDVTVTFPLTVAQTGAITSSSNPGAAASLLASDASGYLQLTRLGIGVAPTVPLQMSLSSAASDRIISVSGVYTTTAPSLGGGGKRIFSKLRCTRSSRRGSNRRTRKHVGQEQYKYNLKCFIVSCWPTRRSSNNVKRFFRSRLSNGWRARVS